MIHKRSFVDEDSCGLACKQPRYLEHFDHLASIVPLDDADMQPIVSGENIKWQDVERSADDLAIAVSNEANNFESDASGSFPHFLWINNGILEADNLSLFPEYFDHGHQLRPIFQPDEGLSSLDYPFQKPVPIGPEHQVFVPDWEGADAFSSELHTSNPEDVTAQSSSSSIIANDGCKERLVGTCVLPMPDSEVHATDGCEGIKSECSCLDRRSIECVKQHIMEVRQKLRENLGEEIFEGLGFCDMGEFVASKWTEEEEQVFLDTVLSNPASFGKNFWDHLSVAFPCRRKSELVSYYFNVFMLRKRAEQNRFDPLNIDSDNDEWHKSEAGEAEEDEDSAVESLNEQAPVYHDGHAFNCNEHIEEDEETDASKESADEIERVATDEEYEGDLDDVSAVHNGIFTVGCGRDTGCKHFKEFPNENANDLDIEDDSCTSYEYHRDNVDCGGPLFMETDGRHSSRV
ncbi:uncharacterized protein LOC126677348 [Mercurialis annua]|uniref:uncharacterized protein LOC126677348 n=1 Tax=Mercurialis annua TaxID=3986 RepID=UPI002160F27F|nr:uncharacterized protein LOC126677348 [Mercurialis annua]